MLLLDHIHKILEWFPLRGSTLVGSSLTWKYRTLVDVKGSDNHFSLLQYVNNYFGKKFYSTGPRFQSGPIP